jgi:pimeloyl-ACP methyl ester carboxylesterase
VVSWVSREWAVHGRVAQVPDLSSNPLSGVYLTADAMPSIRARSRGLLNDARLAGSPARVDFSQIRAPTLVISAEDDRFGTAATARDIAAGMAHAKLVVYPSGGHIWLGHDSAVADEVSRFVSEPAAIR